MATPLGTDDRMLTVGADDGIGGIITGSMEIVVIEDGISNTLAGSMEVAVVDSKGTKSAPDAMAVSADNVIGVEMGDLSEKDRNDLKLELQREMEEVMADRRRKKLACFQKSRSGVIKKGDMMKASTPVNSPFTLEELVHMIDVYVSSKYGTDLEAITRTLFESVRGSVESLKLEFKQESKKLPRQVRATVQQVLGESRDKQGLDALGTSAATMDFDAGNAQGATSNPSITVSRGGGAVNLNL
jgi:hypothetical protein